MAEEPLRGTTQGGGGARGASSWDDQAMEVAIGLLLRVGVSLSALVVIVGGVLYLLQDRGARADYSVFHGVAMPLRQTVWGAFSGVRGGDGRSIILVGLLLLIATPVARVAFAALGFMREKDWMYTGISAGVFAILLYSLLLGR